MATIHFIDQNIKVEARSGTDLIELYKRNPAIPFAFGCCQGHCGTCAIHITQGNENLSKLSPQEESTLNQKGYSKEHRLACQCALNGDITVARKKKTEKIDSKDEIALSTLS